MKKIYKLLVVMFISVGFASCNDEWTAEQYEQMISFKASAGITNVPVRYKAEGSGYYNLPVIVSGSTPNGSNRKVSITLDPDTLLSLNIARYGSRTEIFYKQLSDEYFSFPATIDIPKGENVVLLPISFSLTDIDESERWALPIQVAKDPSYTVNPRQHYSKAILKPIIFNDFSGNYTSSGLLGYIGGDTKYQLNTGTTRAYVVNDSTVFFYAGLRNEDYLDRKEYKVYLRFTDEKTDDGKEYKVDIWADNPTFQFNKQVTYSMTREQHATKIHSDLVLIYVNNIDYEFIDKNTIPGFDLKYEQRGRLTMQRDLDRRFPDEDQSSDSKWW